VTKTKEVVWEFRGPDADDLVWIYVLRKPDGFQPWSSGYAIASPMKHVEDAIRKCISYSLDTLIARLEEHRLEGERIAKCMDELNREVLLLDWRDD
jgi:hypothetical protein